MDPMYGSCHLEIDYFSKHLLMSVLRVMINEHLTSSIKINIWSVGVVDTPSL